MSHSSHDQQRACKALFLASISAWQPCTLLRHEVLLVSVKWGMVLEVEKHSPEVQNQLYGTISDWCLSNLLWEEKPRNREPVVFTGNWFWFFIGFLLSDLVLLLLQLKLICFDLIPGGCREQSNFHAFGKVFEFDGKFEARLSRPLSSGFISDFIKDKLKIPVCLVWKYQIAHLYKMEKNVFIGNTLLLNLISVHNLETMDHGS